MELPPELLERLKHHRREKVHGNFIAKVKHEELIRVLAETLKRFHSVEINPDFNESITHKILRARQNVATDDVRRDIYAETASKTPLQTCIG
ncbi:MAG: hypothetical protein U1B83_02395 [Candidatus Cloacimonadaceae bacterium]|nr:hypothetical protein [Candidatus Cloacimonadaceae bacterium]